MNRYDVCFSTCSCISRFMSEPCTETSSEEMGSSQRMSSGSAAKARAMATRCFSPPLSSCGSRSK